MAVKYVGTAALAELISKIKTALSGKVDKVTGKGLSTNDYSNNDKNKLAGIETGAQVNDIEKITVDGTALTIDANKTVNINLAGATVSHASSADTATSATSAASATDATKLTSTTGAGSYTYDYLAARIKEIKDIAEGRTDTFVADATVTTAFATDADTITLAGGGSPSNTLFKDYSTGTAVNKTFIDVRVGDVILVKDTNYPDRWVSQKKDTNFAIVLSSLESRKMDLSGYALKNDLNTTVTNASAAQTVDTITQTDGVISATFKNINITKSQISDFPQIPQGTVTSVRVQATAPVNSTVNTAQTGTLNTTISLNDAYGDTKNPYASKNAHYVLAAPSSGAGVPEFRELVASDIPSIAISKVTDLQLALDTKITFNDLTAITASEVDTAWDS